MICPNCGTDGEGVFCAVCGAKLPVGSDVDLSPAALRRAAEKAAEEAEAMRRRYEEAAEAAKAMLRAVEAEETAAAKAKAEREESLRRAVMEAEALLSDKTARLTAAQNEQKAAEVLLAERRAAIAEYQNVSKAPENLNAPVYSGWNSNFEYISSPAPESIRKTQESAQDIPRIQPDISRIRQDSAWPQVDPSRPPLDNPQILPETSNNPIPQHAPSGIPQSWIDTSSRMEAVRPPDPAVRSSGAPAPLQNNASPWAPQPEPSPRWPAGSEPPQSEIYSTIVKNIPNEPDAENVLRKAAGYWKDSPPLQTADARAPLPDLRAPQPDPWGLGNTGSSAWPASESQRVKQTDNNSQAAFIPRTTPVKQREERGRRPSKTNKDDFDEDTESEYEDDYEDDDEDDKKPSFLSGILSGFKMDAKKRKADDDDDDEEDYEEEEDDEEEEEDDDDDDDDNDDENYASKWPKWILIGLVAVVIIIGLSLGIGKLLQGPLRNLIGGNQPASNSESSGYPIVSGTDSIEAPVTEITPTETPQVESAARPSFVNPAQFASIPVSAISMTKEGRLVYCCTEPSGIYLLADDYSVAVQLTDMLAYNAVYDPPWIYFSTADGIFRVRQDSSGAPEQIIYETYENPQKFYVYNNYVYFTYKNEDGSWSIHRSDLAEMDNPEPDADGYKVEEELIANIDPDFYMDTFGVYAFADEGVEHADVPTLFAAPASSQHQSEEGRECKNVYFASIIGGGNYLIGTLYVDRFVSSRSDGIIVQTTESGVIKEYMISWLPNQSDYTSREIFDGADGAEYEIRTNDRGSYALFRQVDENTEKQLIADDIEPDVYTIYNNTILYYLTTTDNISYKLMEYDFRSGDTAPKDIIDFGAYDQDIVNIRAKLDRGDVSFDKIILEADSDIIFFSGMVISADRNLFLYNRTNSNVDMLGPAL